MGEDNIDKAYVKLFDAYVGRLRDYVIEDPNNRITVLGVLESIVNDLSCSDVKEGRVEEIQFDYERARKIVKKDLRTDSEVAKSIGINNTLLSKYINGRMPVTHRGRAGKKFLRYLKEKGYNPFNI